MVAARTFKERKAKLTAPVSSLRLEIRPLSILWNRNIQHTYKMIHNLLSLITPYPLYITQHPHTLSYGLTQYPSDSLLRVNHPTPGLSYPTSPRTILTQHPSHLIQVNHPTPSLTTHPSHPLLSNIPHILSYPTSPPPSLTCQSPHTSLTQHPPPLF